MSIRTFPSFQAYLRALEKDPGLREYDITARSAALRCKVTRGAVTNWLARGQLAALKIEAHIVLVRSKDLSRPA